MEEEKELTFIEEDLRQYIRMGALSLGLNLAEDIICKFIIYLRMINFYQRMVNITSVKNPFDIVNKHFLDSLSGLNIIDDLFYDFKKVNGMKMIDVGSGAGFPGVPIKIVLPNSNMTLVEAKKNKTLFLEKIINKLALVDTRLIQDRAERLGKKTEFREKYHIVFSRAVATLTVLCELCLPLCRINGVMIAFKGSSYTEELPVSGRVIEKLGGILESINTIRIPHSNHFRHLLVIRKIKSTPEKYPRKNGVPRKRPLYFK